MAEESIYKEWGQRIKALEKLDDLPPEAKSIIEDLKYETKNHRLTKKALTYQKDIVPLVLEISTDLINLPIKQIDEGITRALKKIAQFSGAVRSSLFITSEDQKIITNTHEWCADQKDSQIGLLQEIRFKRFGYYKEQLLRSECVIINNLNDLPSEASGEREWIKKHGFRSLLFVPLILDKKLYGTFGFYGKMDEELIWPQAYIALLQLISEMFVRALERKKTEEALRESEEKYRRLIEFAQEGIWVIDKENLTTFVNPSMAKMLGYTFEEMQGRHLFSFMGELGIETAKSNLKRRQDGIKEQHDFEFIRKDGRRIVTTVATAPIQDEAGNYEGAIAGVIDITERQQADEKVKESEAKFRQLFDEMKDGLCVYEAIDGGKDFVFKNINAAGEKISNVRKSEIIGKSLYEIRPNIDEFGLVDVLRRVWQTGKAEHHADKFYQDENLQGWFDNYIYKLESGDVVAMFSDNTARNLAEEALKESKEHLEIVINSSADYLMMLDKDHRIQFVNRVEQGLKREDIVGMPLYELVHMDDRARIKSHLDRVVQKGERQQYETVYLRSDKTKAYFSSIVVPLIISGEVRGSVVNSRNVTEWKKADEALKVNLIKYQTLFESLPIGITISDEAGNILESNKIAERLLKLPQEEHAKRKIDGPERRIIRPDGSPMPAHEYASVKALKENRLVENVEMGIIKGEGDITWINVTAIPIPLENYGVVILYTDITERKQEEEKLRESHQIIEGILNAIPVRVFWKDKNLVYLGCNALFAHDAGFDEPKDIIGKDDYQMGWRNQAESYRNDDFEVIESGEGKYLIEEPQTTPEGKTITLLTSKIPLRTAAGEIYGVLGTYMDITARKKIEEELRKSERLHREAQRVAKIGHWELDSPSGTPKWSEEIFHIFGLDPKKSEPSLAAHANIIHDEDWGLLDNSIQELSADGTPFDLEFRIVRPNGETGWMHARGSADKSEDGSVTRMFGTAQDITVIKKAEEERNDLQRKLQQTQKMESIGNLAGGIAHDFNNILSSIIGFTELSLDDVEKGTHIEDNLQEVYAAGKRAKDLVKQILAFARQSDEERKPIQVDLIIKEVLQFIRSSIPTTIEIRQNIESESLIMGSSTQVHQILMNLCTNAAYAMENEGGTLEVNLQDITVDRSTNWEPLGLKFGDYIEIKVSDTGTGIQPEIMKNIFEPYFTTKDPGEGTGMGLAMVHGIVVSYGGKIIVDSILGQGTIFTIYLPITRKRGDYRAYESEELPSGTERVLFVDDEASIAKMGGQVLERLGYKVTIRTSSVEALELFRSKPNDFDLIVTDMTMPNMTGDKLAIELMKIRQDITVILCTGYSKKLSDENAAEFGIKAFAYKPIVKADLAKTVRKVLDEAKSETQA